MSQTIEVVDGMLKITDTNTSIVFVTKDQLIQQITQKTVSLSNLQAKVSALTADIASDQAKLDSLG